MPNVIAGIGAISSGKTTVLKAFALRCDYAYISPDQIREELSGDERNHQQNTRAWGIAYARMGEALREGRTVVLDSTQYKAVDRQSLVAHARLVGADKLIGVYFNVPLETLLERNRHRKNPRPEHAIQRMYAHLNNKPPNLEEGFDVLIGPEELERYGCGAEG